MVAQRMAEGYSDEQIANQLSLSRHTVRHQGERVRLKLDVRSRSAVAALLLGL